MKIDLIELFGPGLIDFSDHGIDKPIKFTEENLREIAAITSDVELTEEHSENIIGSLENFVFKNNLLHVKPPDDIDIKNMGISPVFEMDLKNMGDYFLPVNPVLSKAGLTRKPRSKIFYNSIIDNIEDDNMSETMEQLIKERKEAQDEVAVLKSQLKSVGKTADEKENLEKDLKSKEKEVEDKENEIQSLKDKAEKYDKIQGEIDDKNIDKIAGNDDEFKKHLKENFSSDQIKFMAEKKIITQPPKGVGSGDAPGLDDDGTHVPEDEKESYEDWKKKNNVW